MYKKKPNQPVTSTNDGELVVDISSDDDDEDDAGESNDDQTKKDNREAPGEKII